MRRFLLVGLTGGIATGKSTVSAMFGHLGAKVIDADVLAREVVMPGQPALAEIAAEFGPEVLQADGHLDRKRLGAIVFGDPARRKRLEAITHPAVRARQQRILSVLEEEAFDDIAELAATCRFRDCRHLEEPGCAVRGAVTPERLASFHKLAGERRTAATRQAGAKKLAETRKVRAKKPPPSDA